MRVDTVEDLMATMSDQGLAQTDATDGSSAKASPITGICIGILISLPVWAGIVVALR